MYLYFLIHKNPVYVEMISIYNFKPRIMKKLFSPRFLLRHLALIAFLAGFQIVSGQTTTKLTTGLPDNVNKIVQASCLPCHGENGGMMSKGKLNFSKWSEYDAAEKVKKAVKINSIITEGKMPPKKWLESHPETALTKVQVADLTKWAGSFKPAEVKK